MCVCVRNWITLHTADTDTTLSINYISIKKFFEVMITCGSSIPETIFEPRTHWLKEAWVSRIL